MKNKIRKILLLMSFMTLGAIVVFPVNAADNLETGEFIIDHDRMKQDNKGETSQKGHDESLFDESNQEKMNNYKAKQKENYQADQAELFETDSLLLVVYDTESLFDQETPEKHAISKSEQISYEQTTVSSSTPIMLIAIVISIGIIFSYKSYRKEMNENE